VSDGAIARRSLADGMGYQAQPYDVTKVYEEMTRPAALPPAHPRARSALKRIPG
jgi:hypothetical protein